MCKKGWTERDDGSFTAVSECLVRQYNNYRVKEVSGGIVNGALTLDENFPDNGGLMEAYRAYKRFSSDNNSNGGEMIIPGLEDLTPDQQFFLGYANVRNRNSYNENPQQNLILCVLIDTDLVLCLETSRTERSDSVGSPHAK